MTTYSVPAVTPSATQLRGQIIPQTSPVAIAGPRTVETDAMPTPLSVAGRWAFTTVRTFVAKWPSQQAGGGTDPGAGVPTTGQIWPRALNGVAGREAIATWSSTTAYEAGDYVLWQGSLWLANMPSLGKDPTIQPPTVVSEGLDTWDATGGQLSQIKVFQALSSIGRRDLWGAWGTARLTGSPNVQLTTSGPVQSDLAVPGSGIAFWAGRRARLSADPGAMETGGAQGIICLLNKATADRLTWRPDGLYRIASGGAVTKLDASTYVNTDTPEVYCDGTSIYLAKIVSGVRQQVAGPIAIPSGVTGDWWGLDCGTLSGWHEWTTEHEPFPGTVSPSPWTLVSGS